uniref:Uncharacterized protein n=1 Tax=Ciona savignyi TaxID=51511 RepID=H2YLT2_CIOSA
MRSSRRQSNMTSSPPPPSLWPAAFVDEINNEFNKNRSENQSMPKSFIDEGDSIPSSRAFAISGPYSNLLEKDTMTDGTSFGQNFPFQPTIPTEIRRNEFTSYRPTSWYPIP